MTWEERWNHLNDYLEQQFRDKKRAAENAGSMTSIMEYNQTKAGVLNKVLLKMRELEQDWVTLRDV